jgi:tetratricopeptide (TPR) repeat protein
MRHVSLFLGVAIALLGQTPVPHIKAAQAAYAEGKEAQMSKQIERAIQLFEQAIDIEPTFLDAREALIATYLDSGQELSGAAAITAFLEIKPDAFLYRVRLGQILLRQKQPERALAQFSLVLKQEPNSADALWGFASAARLLGMENRAKAAIENGRKRFPGDERFKDPH